MRSEHDFSKGVRGKYAHQFQAGTNVVVLAPEVAEMFPNSAAVNDALRLLYKSLNEHQHARRAAEIPRRIWHNEIP